jgi:hypothetical protein
MGDLLGFWAIVISPEILVGNWSLIICWAFWPPDLSIGSVLYQILGVFSMKMGKKQ